MLIRRILTVRRRPWDLQRVQLPVRAALSYQIRTTGSVWTCVRRDFLAGAT